MKRTQLYFMMAIALTLCPARAEEPTEFRIQGDAAKGKVLFEALCISCHGKSGDGKGVVGARLKPALPDFNNAEHMFTIKDPYLFKIVKNGGQVMGQNPIMHAWSSTLSDQQIHDVIAYIKTFARGYARANHPPKEKLL